MDTPHLRFPAETSAHTIQQWVVFARNAENTVPSVVSLHLRGCTRISDQDVSELLRACINLKRLDVSDCSQLTANAFLMVKNGASCDDLTWVNLSGTGITCEAIFRMGSRFHKLKVLHLSRCPNLTNGVELREALEASGLRKLIALYLANLPSECELDSAFTKKLPLSLQIVDVSGCATVTDETLKQLLLRPKSKVHTIVARGCDLVKGSFLTGRNLAHLQYIDLRNCKNLDNELIPLIVEANPALEILTGDFNNSDSPTLQQQQKNKKRRASTSVKMGNVKRAKLDGSSILEDIEVEPQESEVVNALEMLQEMNDSIDDAVESSGGAVVHALCTDLIFPILDFLELHDYSTLSQVCRAWYRSITTAKKSLQVIDFRKQRAEHQFYSILTTRQSQPSNDVLSPRLKWNQITDAMLDVVITDCPFLTKIYLSNCNKITDSGVSKILDCLQKLETLDLSGCQQITYRALTRVNRVLPNIKELRLQGVKITEAFLSRISSLCPNLVAISLKALDNLLKSHADSVINLLQQCSHIHELDLDDFSCFPQILDALVDTDLQLTSLKLSVDPMSGIPDISGRIDRIVGHFSMLNKLVLQHLGLSHSAIKNICCLRHIETLAIVQDLQFESLNELLRAEFPVLRELFLTCTHDVIIHNTDSSGIPPFPLHRHTRAFALTLVSRMSDAWLATLIASFPMLTWVHIYCRERIVGPHTSHLATWISTLATLVGDKLRHFHANTEIINDKAIETLVKHCPKIQELTVTSAQLTGKCINSIVQFAPQIRVLDVTATMIPVFHLCGVIGKLPNLEYISGPSPQWARLSRTEFENLVLSCVKSQDTVDLTSLGQYVSPSDITVLTTFYPNIKTLKLGPNRFQTSGTILYRVDELLVSIMKNLPDLSSLTLHTTHLDLWSSFSARMASTLQPMSQVTNLEVIGCNFASNSAQMRWRQVPFIVKLFPNVRWLNLQACGSTGAIRLLELAFSHFPHLRALSLADWDLRNQLVCQVIFNNLRYFRQLEHIDLSNWSQGLLMFDEIFLHCTRLKSCQLFHTNTLPLESYRALARHCAHNLTKLILHFDGSDLNNDLGKLFASCSKLENLWLSGARVEPKRLIESLKGCSQLCTLTLQIHLSPNPNRLTFSDCLQLFAQQTPQIERLFFAIRGKAINQSDLASIATKIHAMPSLTHFATSNFRNKEVLDELRNLVPARVTLSDTVPPYSSPNLLMPMPGNPIFGQGLILLVLMMIFVLSLLFSLNPDSLRAAHHRF